MKKQIIRKFLVSGFVLFFCSCDFMKEEEASENETQGFTNTLNQSLGGDQGAISEYFYNFENDVNATFFRYNPNLMANYNTYMDYYSLFGEDPTRMSLRTFPNHLLAMTSADESEFTERNYIDSL